MKKLKMFLWAAAAIFALMVIFGAFYVVTETDQVVLLQLGKPVKVIAGDRTEAERQELQAWMDENAPGVNLSFGAGLHFKIPFLQQARFLDDRILEYDDAPADVVTRDKKHIQVDSYARWRIDNPLLFVQSVQTVNQARSRLDDIIYSAIRQELGRNDLIQIVRSTNDPIGLGSYVRLVENVSTSEPDSMRDVRMEGGEVIEETRLVYIPEHSGRLNILKRITEQTRGLAEQYGIQIIDVRIKRADLPAENQEAVFRRMEAERNRISTRYRAEGHRMSRRITAETDLAVDSISARADLEALTIRGQADSTAAAIYAQAYETYPEFYRFSRSLETLQEVIDSTSRLVISTEGVMEYLSTTPGEVR
jgi:membrane protease subunit HflC